jgi:hypothetical protein
MGQGETKEDSKALPQQWVPKEDLLKIFRGLPPDPSLLDEIREMSGTLEELGDPWER